MVGVGATRTNVKDFATLRSCIRLRQVIQEIALKLGNFTNFRLFFSTVSIDFAKWDVKN